VTARGKLVLTILILGAVGYGVWNWWGTLAPNVPLPLPGPLKPPAATAGKDAGEAPALAVTQTQVPRLAPPGTYLPKDKVVEVELSEYAGYAGLIAANRGLLPNDDSVFARKHGFKVKITLSEEESWSALNSGKIAASATTVDVLAVYGRQFAAVVPAQIGYSRGADGVVVRSEVARINHLKGKTLVASQFTEADFFIRYLAQEAGLGIHLPADLAAPPAPDKVNLVYAEDAFTAGDLFLQDVKSGANRLAGCVTWDPKTGEVVRESGGKARILATNLNLLIVADILVVNQGFAKANPALVAGLVDGLQEGNRMVRDNPDLHLDVVGKAFGWDRATTKAELAKVHLANLPENIAFFTGAMDAAGSFSGIYQSAVLAYGPQLIRDPVDGERFLDLSHLKALEKSGAYREQKVAIVPIRTGGGGTVEGNPLLNKDIRFLFEPNSAKLNLEDAGNIRNLEALRDMLRVSPGSTILLRGHVDNAMIEEFRKKGGEPFVRQMALKAMELSKNRAAEIKRILVERHKMDQARLETVGRGWEEPLGSDSEKNRRVEAQWFMLE
jgi:NitT/TauT family transport system substrate-binding protein